MDFADPARLDKQVEEAAKALSRWRRDARVNLEEARDQSPFAGRREVSTRAGFQEAQKLPAGSPGKEALARWIACLTVERVTLDDMNEFESARQAADHVVQGLGKEPWSLRDLVLESVQYREAGRRALAAEPVVRRAGEASALALWWLARRQEAARQLGLNSLAELEAPYEPGLSSERLAVIVLDATEDLARDVIGRGRTWNETLALGTASDALEGWPARLSVRWLQELFGTTELARGLRVDPGTIPPAVNGASFARALARFGAALQRGAAKAIAPSFVMSQQPFDAAPARHGALFSSLLASPAFVRRRQGLGAATAPSQVRSFARAFLISLRVAASRAAIAEQTSEAAARQAHALHMSRALVSSIPAEVTGLVPRYDPRSAAFIAGALLAAGMREQLVSAFDDDWFDNPHAHDRLRAVDITSRLLLSEESAVAGVRAAVRFLGEPFR